MTSLVVHTAVVMSFSGTTEIALSAQKESVFSIKIAEIKHELANSGIAAPIIKKAAIQTKPVINKKYKTPAEEIKEVRTEENNSIRQKKQNKILAQVRSDLIKKLKTNFTYPKLAQRKNWQGKVILSLRITASGEIKNIQLSSSSGYNVLDMAAIASLQQVGKLPNISLWFNNDINLQLPVIYELIES